jgi:GDP-mannose 6-dehydrogenase
LYFSPEFLTERRAAFDAEHPTRQIVGCVFESQKDTAYSILLDLPSAPYMVTTDATEAELLKYFSNVFFAMKVAFANVMHDLAVSLLGSGHDADKFREMVARDPMIVDEHLQVMHQGYRGFGGKCLPKDLCALRDLLRERGLDDGILRAVWRYNQDLMYHEALAGRHSDVQPQTE